MASDPIEDLYLPTPLDKAIDDAKRITGGVLRPLTPEEHSRSLLRLLLEKPAGEASLDVTPGASPVTPGGNKPRGIC